MGLLLLLVNNGLLLLLLLLLLNGCLLFLRLCGVGDHSGLVLFGLLLAAEDVELLVSTGLMVNLDGGDSLTVTTLFHSDFNNY